MFLKAELWREAGFPDTKPWENCKAALLGGAQKQERCSSLHPDLCLTRHLFLCGSPCVKTRLSHTCPRPVLRPPAKQSPCALVRWPSWQRMPYGAWGSADFVVTKWCPRVGERDTAGDQMVPFSRTPYCIRQHGLRPRGPAIGWAGSPGGRGRTNQEWGSSDRYIWELTLLAEEGGRIWVRSSASLSFVRFLCEQHSLTIKSTRLTMHPPFPSTSSVTSCSLSENHPRDQGNGLSTHPAILTSAYTFILTPHAPPWAGSEANCLWVQ